MTVSVVRGFGFGLCTVMTGALTAALLPPDLYVVDDGAPKRRVFVTSRIGVQGTGRWEKRLLRYVVDSPALSRHLRPSARRGR